ncbi:MAG: bifunctional ADP-heptose synthase [Bacteroidales bacterium]|nr:bifunctional ADP-heptose synthase [Bacteroidales bacterium]
MNKIDIEKIFNSFNNFNIIIIGDVMIDSYMWGKVSRISPEAPVPIISSTYQENRLGGAANVALNVQALGANAILCSLIGKDSKARTFYSLLKKRKLTQEGIVEDQSRKTTVKTRIISDNQQLLRVDEEIDTELDANLENIFIDRIKEIILSKKIDAIIFEDYDKGCITKKVISDIVELANNKNIVSLVDPKKRNFNNYKNATFFKPNFKELLVGTKSEICKDDFDGIFDLVKKLQKKISAKFIMVTLSELGVFISNSNSYKIVPAEIRDIADVSGAGDTMISIASLCLAAGLDAEDIATISNIAGGLVCEKIGVVPVEKKNLLLECKQKFNKKIIK